MCQEGRPRPVSGTLPPGRRGRAGWSGGSDMQGVNDVSVRVVTVADRDVLARATLDNINWSGPRFTMSEVESTPQFRHYYDGWSDAEDYGLLAQNTEGVAVGVVWLRCFAADDPGYGFVAETIPELSIWTSAKYRGRGVGGMLLHRVVEAARSRGVAAISLSVEDGNPAARLYERHGFRPAPDGPHGCLLLELGSAFGGHDPSAADDPGRARGRRSGRGRPSAAAQQEAVPPSQR